MVCGSRQLYIGIVLGGIAYENTWMRTRLKFVGVVKAELRIT